MTDQQTNPFATAEAWSPGGSILTARKEPYLCTIREIEQGTSSGNYPQLTVRFGNEEGEITDWIVTKAVGKVVALAESAGVGRPNDQQVRPEGEGFVFHPDWIKSFEGKQIGVVVRQERDRTDPTRMRDRVAGYTTPDKAQGPSAGGGAGSWTGGAQPTSAPGFQVGAGAQSAIDDDIPF
jgi:hypothetical protein